MTIWLKLLLLLLRQKSQDQDIPFSGLTLIKIKVLLAGFLKHFHMGFYM
jgi:hypothetical protein